jgi:hypothetical protein
MDLECLRNVRSEGSGTVHGDWIVATVRKGVTIA